MLPTLSLVPGRGWSAYRGARDYDYGDSAGLHPFSETA